MEVKNFLVAVVVVLLFPICHSLANIIILVTLCSSFFGFSSFIFLCYDFVICSFCVLLYVLFGVVLCL